MIEIDYKWLSRKDFNYRYHAYHDITVHIVLDPIFFKLVLEER